MNRLGRLAYFLAWPALFVYLRIGSRTRILVRSGNDILLVRGWLDDDKYGLPGGGLHSREAVEVGAARELCEETGISVNPTGMKRLASEQVRHNGLRYNAAFLSVTMDAKPTLKLQRFEIVDAKWVDIKKVAPTACKPEVSRALQLLAER